MAMGQDDHPVSTERETKSVSAETTLAEDVSELEELRAIVTARERAGSSPPRQQRPPGADGDAEAAAVGFHDVHAAGHPPLAGERRFPDRRGRPGHPRARGNAGPLVPPHRRRRVPLRPRAGEPATGAVWGGVRGLGGFALTDLRDSGRIDLLVRRAETGEAGQWSASTCLLDHNPTIYPCFAFHSHI